MQLQMNGYMGIGPGVRLVSIAGMLVAASVLSGCATSGKGDIDAAPKSEQALLAEASEARDSGRDDAAVELLRQAAERNPVSVTPWLNIAQIRFDANSYDTAIVAAEEAVNREPSNLEANSIIIVSSLRLAERAIKALRADSKLEGSVRSEAQALAQQLRETLGEDVLVGDSTPRRRSAPRRARRAAAASSSGASSSNSKKSSSSSGGPSTPAGPDNQGSSGGSLDPFESLQTLPQ